MIKKIFLFFYTLSYLSNLLATQCRDGSYCPGLQTCCLAMYGVGCCPYEDAICCGDGIHCCPNGFICGDNSCYKSTGDGKALAYVLSKSNGNGFLEASQNKNESKNDKNLDNNEKSEKALLNKSSKSDNKNLLFLDTKQNKDITTTPSSFFSKTKLQIIIEKFDYLNNSFFKKLMGCFKDMEPLIKDLMNAYQQKSENRTESLMKFMSKILTKLYFDGVQITTDCKSMLSLAGFAGII